MRAAWEQVAAKKGAAGVDGVSIKRWRRNWEERLVNLAAAVRANTYKPQPLQRFTRPKPDGSLRHLANLTVTDKVLQRAALRVLDDHFERHFLDCSYGYRQGRGCATRCRPSSATAMPACSGCWTPTLTNVTIIHLDAPLKNASC